VQNGFNDLEVADLNEDGFADLIATYTDKVEIFSNDGAGNFVKDKSNTSFKGDMQDYGFVNPVDMDGDGQIDLVMTKQDRIDILIKDKTGQYGLNRSLRLESEAVVVEIEDCDDDGECEIFIVDAKGRLVEFDNIMLPDGDRWQLVHGENLVDVSKLEFIDMDGDGDKDISLLKEYGGAYVFYWDYPGFYQSDMALSADAVGGW
jgi:hypothetical protein